MAAGSARTAPNDRPDALSRTIRQEETMQEVDVVVIGAGAAGLGAAKALRAAGRSFVVIEAMDRIGGRAWTTRDDFGIPFDIGCAWLHAADRNPFMADAQAHGWTLHHHDAGIDHLYFDAEKAGAEEMAKLAEAEALLVASIAAHDGPNDRLSDLIENCHFLRANATYSGPMDFAKDSDEISIADYQAAEDLDPNYFTLEGFGALIHRWGADVPVTLNCPARLLRWDGPGVLVETEQGTIRARAAIVTVSTGALAFDALRFAPALPVAHQEAIFDLPLGLLTKIPIRFNGSHLGLAAFDDLLIEGFAKHDLYFLCFPFDLDLMVGFVGGDFAWEMEAAGEAAALDYVAGKLVAIFGSDARRHMGKGRMTNWSGERWVRGAYASARPGRAGARQVLAEPVGERIWFAGEALASGLIQTAAGARLSGEAVGRRVAAGM